MGSIHSQSEGCWKASAHGLPFASRGEALESPNLAGALLEGSIKGLAMDAGGKVKEKKARLPAAIYIQTREEGPTRGLKREGPLSTQMRLD